MLWWKKKITPTTYFERRSDTPNQLNQTSASSWWHRLWTGQVWIWGDTSHAMSIACHPISLSWGFLGVRRRVLLMLPSSRP